VEPGLYVTFFTAGEAFDKELPPVGPLEHVVLRDRSLVAERREVQHGADFGGALWLEAEHELQRALGVEPGGVRRPDLRIGAPEGVYLRFVTFGESARDPLPELGPYAVVVIGADGVEADGDRLAARGTTRNTWELTGAGGTAFVGMARPDVAFRTRSTTYHPQVPRFGARPAPQPTARAHGPAAPLASAPTRPETKAPPMAAVAATVAPPRPARVEVAPAVAMTPTRAATGVAEPPVASLRERIGTESAPTVLRARQRGRAPLEFAGALWRLRFVVIAVLLVLIGVFSVPAVRSFFDGSRPTWTTVGANTNVNATDWTYSLGITRRVSRLGQAQARGTYYVVQIAATNRSRAGAEVQPSNFTLVAENGTQYVAQPSASSVYSSQNNLDSPYLWPREFPVGRQVVVALIFDVDPAVTGGELAMLDVPGTRIRLS
jgi:hypothetical protein